MLNEHASGVTFGERVVHLGREHSKVLFGRRRWLLFRLRLVFHFDFRLSNLFLEIWQRLLDNGLSHWHHFLHRPQRSERLLFFYDCNLLHWGLNWSGRRSSHGSRSRSALLLLLDLRSLLLSHMLFKLLTCGGFGPHRVIFRTIARFIPVASRVLGQVVGHFDDWLNWFATSEGRKAALRCLDHFLLLPSTIL